MQLLQLITIKNHEKERKRIKEFFKLIINMSCRQMAISKVYKILDKICIKKKTLLLQTLTNILINKIILKNDQIMLMDCLGIRYIA